MKNRILKIKQNKGFTTADIVVSIIVIMIFVGMITTLFYNFYLSTSAKNRNAMATNYIIDVIEEIKSMEYDSVQTDNETSHSINGLIETLEAKKGIPKEYTITGEVQKYNETLGNTDKKDLVKILTIRAEYTLGNKTEKIEISTLLIKMRSEL